MNDKYIVYRCLKCGKLTILLSEEVDHSEEQGKYLTCGHDGRHSDLIVVDKCADIIECMGNRSYKRVNGRIRRLT